MSNTNNFFEDFTRLSGSMFSQAINNAEEWKNSVDAMLKERIEALLRDSSLVTREEFEVVKAMAEQAREENESLKQQLAELNKPASSKKGGK